MKKSCIMGVALSISILTSFIPAEAAQSARQKAYQAWKTVKKGTGEAAAFLAKKHKAASAAALAAAGIAAGAYGLHRLKSRNTPPKKGWYLLDFSDTKTFPGWHWYVVVEDTTLSPPTVTYAIEKVWAISRDDLITRTMEPVTDSTTVPLETFNADYPNRIFIDM